MSSANAIAPLKAVLALQKPEPLARQKGELCRRLGDIAPGANVICAGSSADVPEGAEVDAVIAPGLPWLPDALRRIRGPAWLHLLSAGADSLADMDYPFGDLVVTKSAGVHGPAMSEFAIGAMLYLEKQLGRFRAQQSRRAWERAWLGELTGKTLAIVGLGAVGSCLAKRAKAFDMRCVGVARTMRPTEGIDEVYQTAELPKALAQANYVVLALPLTAETRGLVDKNTLADMKPGAGLIDLSRGGIVVERDLASALESGHLSGAVLDVFEREPLPESSPLWDLENVLITPHVAGTTPHYLQRALDIFAQNYVALRAGRGPVTPVDLAAGY